MESEELKTKQEEIVMLSMEIARLRKVLGIKQRQFDRLDTEIYNALKSKEHEEDLSKND